MATEEKAAAIEEQVKSLKEELEICKEAKTQAEACGALVNFAQEKEEPFATSHHEPNEWHKNPGGGGGMCVVLVSRRG